MIKKEHCGCYGDTCEYVLENDTSDENSIFNSRNYYIVDPMPKPWMCKIVVLRKQHFYVI